MFIVLEGIDGTGKSTQAKLLGKWFENQGREVVLSREPTDGPWGRKLRESATTGRLSPADELEVFLNDRRQHVEELIRPSLADAALARIGTRGDTANEFEQRESLEACRNVFLSLTNEPFAHLVDCNAPVETVHERMVSCL
jgi:dTMP kinase